MLSIHLLGSLAVGGLQQQHLREFYPNVLSESIIALLERICIIKNDLM